MAALSTLLFAAQLASVAAAPVPRTIDLQGALGSARPWRLEVIPLPTPATEMDDDQPGPIALCLRAGPQAPCDPALRTRLDDGGTAGGLYSQPHKLDVARVVWPQGRGGRPLLLLVTSSRLSEDNGHLILTQALRPGPRGFRRVYAATTGSNNDQDTRYIESGPLEGALIRVEPTPDAPYGFWVSVNRPDARGAYRQVLRYRSRTRYGDGDPLPVAYSDWPETMRRLHLWRAGPPPLPPGLACPTPRLRRGELWCGAAQGDQPVAGG